MSTSSSGRRPDPIDLALLGPLDDAPASGPDRPDPLRDWSASGAMALTGRAGGPASTSPAGCTLALSRLAARYRALCGIDLDGPALLGERAAFGGYGRNGDISCSGATRLLSTADGWLALGLARPDDLDLLGAWLGRDWRPSEPPWPELADELGRRPTERLVAEGALLGLPVAALGEVGPSNPGRYVDLGPASPVRARPLVVNLASLWSGPLCAQLLGAAGGDVVKVEGSRRPDGARDGERGFFDLLNGGHRSVAIDFGTEQGRSTLRRLLRAADVVVEGSRPRVLDGMSCGPEQLTGGPGPTVWVSVTGYGRSGPGANRVAFGDDAAVAGGLVARDGEGPMFCADAVADPATGLWAAVAALLALGSGRRWLIELSMAGMASLMASTIAEAPTGRIQDDEVAPPRHRPVEVAGPEHGEHTDEVLSALESGQL